MLNETAHYLLSGRHVVSLGCALVYIVLFDRHCSILFCPNLREFDCVLKLVCISLMVVTVWLLFSALFALLVNLYKRLQVLSKRNNFTMSSESPDGPTQKRARMANVSYPNFRPAGYDPAQAKQDG